MRTKIIKNVIMSEKKLKKSKNTCKMIDYSLNWLNNSLIHRFNNILFL